ncbi:MAG: tetratricopeptide repeat protein [Treponemataceae bacterium]
MIKRGALVLFVVGMLSVAVSAQESTALNRGLELYRNGRWRDAIIALRQTSATANPLDAAEALYWIALSELASGDYEASLRDLDELARKKTSFSQSIEIPYQKGRVLYHLTRYEEAIQILKTYSDASGDDARKSASAYWIGECLYALGRFDEARAVFSLIVERFPESVKYEAAYYRVALIDQKGREMELLKLLKWSHEESLKTVEEYQKRERSYEQAIVAYQKRIADMLKDSRLADLENQAKQLNTRIAALEKDLNDANARADQALKKSEELAALLEGAKAESSRGGAAAVSAPPAQNEAQRFARLLAIKSDALELKDAITKRIAKDVK